jgi:hypothetical protein
MSSSKQSVNAQTLGRAGPPIKDFAKKDANPQWLQNRSRNMKQSHLYRLLNELLFRITDEFFRPGANEAEDIANGATRQILRRTCSLFMRLIANYDLIRLAKLSKDHADFDDAEALSHYRGQIWPKHGTRAQRDKQRSLVKNILARDVDVDVCTACKISHKTSDHNRRLARVLGEEKWCSGCTDHHSVVFFSAAQRDTADGKRICIGREGVVRLCPHKSLSSDDMIVACQEANRARKETIVKDTHCLNCESLRPPGRYSRSHRPWAVALEGRTCFERRWEIEVLELDPRAELTKEGLRQTLAAQRENLGAFLCPHIKFDDGQLLLPFEHGNCACFGGPQPEGHQFLRHGTWKKTGSWRYSCRNHKADNPRLAGTFITDDSYTRHHGYECSQCLCEYSWHRQGGKVYLSMSKIFHCGEAYKTDPSPLNLEWLMAIDPESWGITQDEELRHIAWCPDSSCGTSIRWRALLRLLLKAQRLRRYSYPRQILFD